MTTSTVTVNADKKGHYLKKHKAIIIETDGGDITVPTTLVIPSFY